MIKITAGTVAKFQEFITDSNLDGWLIYDFHDINPFAKLFLPIDKKTFLSRRWFYYVPAKGTPQLLVHRIEENFFEHLHGELSVYSGWQELEAGIGRMIKGAKKIAMEYSPGAALPYVSTVDAGTIEMVRNIGVDVVSSGDIIQFFHSKWSLMGYKLHKATVPRMHKIRMKAFKTIADTINNGNTINEYEIQRQMMSDFAVNGLITDHPPIIAVNEHAALPHYAPSVDSYSPIKRGDLILIDMWAKMKDQPDATYVDITWTGFVGEDVPEEMTKVFNIVRDARDAAVNFVAAELDAGRPVKGGDADNACRKVIDEAGYGEYFTHRTGHSIDTEVHGAGVNIDAMEVRDDRQLIDGVGFSIEPGIYLPGKFGIRSEIDCYMADGKIEVTTAPSQEEVLPLLRLFR